MPTTANGPAEPLQINSSQIASFLAVARMLNFTRAAEEFYISQPVLSRRVAALENELVRGVIIVGQAMPMATKGTLFCLKYDVDAKPVMQGTFISVIASVLTIPLVTMLVEL